MTFIPVALQLQNAVKTSDFIKVEELILTSDSKRSNQRISFRKW